MSKPIAYNHHRAGLLPDVFAADPAISEMFEITSLNHDREGKEFVSSIEARDFDTYPFWGVSICFQICHLLSVVARCEACISSHCSLQFVSHRVLCLIVSVAP